MEEQKDKIFNLVHDLKLSAVQVSAYCSTLPGILPRGKLAQTDAVFALLSPRGLLIFSHQKGCLLEEGGLIEGGIYLVFQVKEKKKT